MRRRKRSDEAREIAVTMLQIQRLGFKIERDSLRVRALDAHSCDVCGDEADQRLSPQYIGDPPNYLCSPCFREWCAHLMRVCPVLPGVGRVCQIFSIWLAERTGRVVDQPSALATLPDARRP